MVPGKKAPKKSKTRAKKKKSNNYSEPVLKRGYPQFSSILPSGKRLHNYGKSPFSMGKSTISITIFNSFLYVYQEGNGISNVNHPAIGLPPWLWTPGSPGSPGPARCAPGPGHAHVPAAPRCQGGLSWDAMGLALSDIIIYIYNIYIYTYVHI